MSKYVKASNIRFSSNFSSVLVNIYGADILIYPQPSSRVHNIANLKKGSHITYKGYTDHEIVELAIDLAAAEAGTRVHHSTRKSQARLHHFLLKSVRGYL